MLLFLFVLKKSTTIKFLFYDFKLISRKYIFSFQIFNMSFKILSFLYIC